MKRILSLLLVSGAGAGLPGPGMPLFDPGYRFCGFRRRRLPASVEARRHAWETAALLLQNAAGIFLDANRIGTDGIPAGGTGLQLVDATGRPLRISSPDKLPGDAPGVQQLLESIASSPARRHIQTKRSDPSRWSSSSMEPMPLRTPGHSRPPALPLPPWSD